MPSLIVLTSSRLSRLWASICKYWSRVQLWTARMWLSTARCVSCTYCRASAAARISAELVKPKALREETSKWLSKTWLAAARLSCLSLTSVTNAPSFSAIDLTAARSSQSAVTRISAGWSLASSLSRLPPVPWPRLTVINSPVDISSEARPIVLPSQASAARNWFSSASSCPSINVPGVITRTTSRLTTPFASLGSSSCSHRATR